MFYQLCISRGPLVLSRGERENKTPQWLAAKAEKRKLAMRWMFYESALINLETTYPEKARTRERASPKRSSPRLRVSWAGSGLRAAGRPARVSGASPLTRPTQRCGAGACLGPCATHASPAETRLVLRGCHPAYPPGSRRPCPARGGGLGLLQQDSHPN